jgi:hypothetical protein
MKIWLKNKLHAFCAETEGSVSVEFILVLPLLFWWFATSFVFFDAFSAHNKSTTSSYMVSDILSRQTDIDNAYLDGLESFLKFMTNEDTNVWMRISSVQYTDTDGYEVVWSYSTGTEASLVTDDIYSLDLDDEYLPVMASGEAVILAETYVPYDPFYDVGLLSRTWSNIIVTRPRFTSQIANSDF